MKPDFEVIQRSFTIQKPEHSSLKHVLVHIDLVTYIPPWSKKNSLGLTVQSCDVRKMRKIHLKHVTHKIKYLIDVRKF